MRRGVRLPTEALQPYLLEFPPPPTAPTPLDWASVFGNHQHVEIEVGFGKGLFLLTSAHTRPDVNLVGIEIERKYVMFTANRVAKRRLRNVRLCCADARIFLRDVAPVASVQMIHVFFPDPWWKHKHRKRRLFTADFAAQCGRTLTPDGALHLVTDVEAYFSEILELMARQGNWLPLPPPQPSDPRHDMDYLTNFERKYRREGRPIFRTLFKFSGQAPS